MAISPKRPKSDESSSTGSQSPTNLYKTELCRSWEETGNCRYGNKCQFAHGKGDLRPVARHPKYKTEVCRTYTANGTCPYGIRCRFIHTSSPSSSTSTNTTSNASSSSSISSFSSSSFCDSATSAVTVTVMNYDKDDGRSSRELMNNVIEKCNSNSNSDGRNSKNKRLPVFQEICSY